MKIKLKNLGVIKQAEFELSDLTIICGNNNTGKTYAAYALFGFLNRCHDLLAVDIESSVVDTLLDKGTVHIDLAEYSSKANDILQRGCDQYTKWLPKIFSAHDTLFKESKFQITIDNEPFLDNDFERKIGSENSNIFSFSKTADNQELIVSLLVKKREVTFPKNFIKKIISDVVIEIIFNDLLPNSFISSAERTGAVIFSDELDFSRNRLLKDMYHLDKDKDPRDLLFKNYQTYALPVECNVEFIRRIPSISKQTSFIANQHPEILDYFNKIIGGKYGITKDNGFHFKPNNASMKLTMSESSSTVRSLLDIGFYLRHVAQKGDLLIVDEPELNLHPENQCLIARLFARLVNIGIKVFITTHSDYMVKEFNTLIMLNSDKPYIKKIAHDEGYNENELICADKVKVYIAEDGLIKLEGKTRKSRHLTLTQAPVDAQLGIEVKSFDKTIDKMNRIQNAIVWGGD